MMASTAPRAATATTRTMSAWRRPSTTTSSISPRARRACAARASSSSSNANGNGNGSNKTLVKVCGITSVEDCAVATASGADFIGMILWPKSKRSVTEDVAKAIAARAKADGAIPIAVFVDEDAATIVRVCDAIGVDHAQLHGDGARDALEALPMRVRAVWVLNADANGKIVTKFPGDEDKLIAARQKSMSGEQGWRAAVDFVNGPRRVVDWLLIDGVNAGSGTAFDWTKLKAPRGASRKGWLLAGGLTPENVAEAIDAAHPNGVDVASGVADASGVAKDEAKIKAFVANARNGATTTA